ncbi:MAG: hypothetical protein IPO17_00230 [Flavobacteriales bacterium]|nr:hypothetical protein [Flavobacteriales bacterium]
MRSTSLAVLTLLVIIVGLTGCAKESADLAQDVGLLSNTCGTEGARLQATVDGASYCGNAQLIATGSEGTVIVTGVDLTGSTLIIQADSLAVGEQAITDATNGVLYMQNSAPYVVLPGQPGTLTITHVDTTAHVFKANFNVTLHNEMSGGTRSVQGSVDVVYTVEE